MNADVEDFWKQAEKIRNSMKEKEIQQGLSLSFLTSVF
jgi:hypothetical protein